MNGTAIRTQGRGSRCGARPSRGAGLSLCLAVASVLPGLRADAFEMPPSMSPPGGLAPAHAPQIVLLTFDDAVNTASYVRVQQVLNNHVNPNGHPVKATFFVTLGGLFDPYAIRRLYDAGHEIAAHTMSHQTDETCDLVRWRQELAGERRTLARLCGIPAEEIVGFRAPSLRPNDHAFRVIFERQFLYDSSFPEYLSGLSTAPTNMLWPYTLDQGLAQVADPALAPATNYPGLFEIPLWPQFTNTVPVILMTPPDTLSLDAVVAIWKTNFLDHYHGNRAPYGLYMHAAATYHWLADPTNSEARIAALSGFIDWALAQPDTWFITCRDLADFMRAPVPASAAATNPPFLTPVRTPFPTAEVSRCSFPGTHIFYVCGACPPADPDYTNAYLGLVPMAGGQVSLNVLSQDTTYAWCSMAVSNDVSQQIYDWSVSFTLTGGTAQGLYDVIWTQIVDQVSATARQYASHILPGAARVLTFRVLRTESGEAVTFSDASVAASGLGPQPIWMDILPLAEPAGWRLTWDDNAYLYQVECSTNLLDPQAWAAVTNELCQPALTEPSEADGAMRFYRVQGTIY